MDPGCHLGEDLMIHPRLFKVVEHFINILQFNHERIGDNDRPFPFNLARYWREPYSKYTFGGTLNHLHPGPP